MRRNVSFQVSLCGMFRLNRVDTLSRVHFVGFIVERFLLALASRNLRQVYMYLNQSTNENFGRNVLLI